ncbi:MAG: hypothetical protein LBE92_20615 [Chryseobacterium sp.]|jgi:hypothetical protein|uniref:hypothetical protein n=1 Tax=Chryseobacterium sp. TaxID=1871047 RepID=UPI002834A3BF|nr:hypothetical protein [Chryseobacterium sp.]MDR2238539.1 hypothetical protein [Chryseobacterium sp.]
MFHKAIILTLGMLALSGCNAQKNDKTAPQSTGTTTSADSGTQQKDKKGIVYLNEGENKFLKEYQMNVTFKGISEDSRCPEGVNCIWAGAAVAQVEAMLTTSRPMTLNLATLDHPGKNYHQSADFNGYIITLEEVTPYPKSQNGTKALSGKYRIGISIKEAGTSSVPTTK